MNDAHIHLIINHIPILGTLFGLLLFIAGLIRKSLDLKSAALVTFIICGMAAFPVSETGEGAERILKKMIGTSIFLIHEHEEAAELASLLGYVLCVLSIIALYLNIKKHPQSGKMNYLIFFWAIVTCSVLTYAGYTGGQIKHTEARENFIIPGE